MKVLFDSWWREQKKVLLEKSFASITRQIYLRGLILKTIYGLGSVLKEMTEGVCYWVESAIATGGKGEPAIAIGGKGGERRVSSVPVAL